MVQRYEAKYSGALKEHDGQASVLSRKEAETTGSRSSSGSSHGLFHFPDVHGSCSETEPGSGEDQARSWSTASARSPSQSLATASSLKSTEAGSASKKGIQAEERRAQIRCSFHSQNKPSKYIMYMDLGGGGIGLAGNQQQHHHPSHHHHHRTHYLPTWPSPPLRWSG